MEEKIKKYLDVEHELDKLSDEIYEYIFSNHGILLEKDSSKHCCDFWIALEHFAIQYYYDDYEETNTIFIPLEYIYNNTWKEYIQELEKQKIADLRHEN